MKTIGKPYENGDLLVFIYRYRYLVGGLEHFQFFHRLEKNKPNRLLFLRGVAQPPTSHTIQAINRGIEQDDCMHLSDVWIYPWKLTMGKPPLRDQTLFSGTSPFFKMRMIAPSATSCKETLVQFIEG